MALANIVAPVTYERLVTTISMKMSTIHANINTSSASSRMPIINHNSVLQTSSLDSPIMSVSESYRFHVNNMLEHQIGRTTIDFLDCIDEETLSKLANDFELDSKTDLPELEDIEMVIRSE